LPQAPVFSTEVVVAKEAAVPVTVIEDKLEELAASLFVPRNTAL
jgi:hypothetical protein